MTPCEVRELHGDGTIEAVSIENTATGEVVQVPCEALITLLGFHSHLGAIASGGSSSRASARSTSTRGHVRPRCRRLRRRRRRGYEGKITLITIGMGEAAIAANNAIARIRGEKVQPKYSTD
jgi:thioredoxin reductase (NADPH)